MVQTPLIILDFGSQFTQLIARAVREIGVYSEIVPYSTDFEHIKKRGPKGLILSGGPSSVLERTSPKLGSQILSLNVPVLGICYGMQLLSHMHRGSINSGQTREYGFSEIEILESAGIFSGLKRGTKHQVWMSHGDSVENVPKEALVTAKSERCPVSALSLGQFYGVQFHPEVEHTPIGKIILSNFLFRICGIKADWKMSDFLMTKRDEIVSVVGENEVIGAVSGGVDSTVLAVFLGKILGKKFHPILIDTGLLRHNEAQEIKVSLKTLGIPLKVVSSEERFLKSLRGVSSPEKKRKIIGNTFIQVFEKECRHLKKAKFLAQGTLYPDVIESVSVKGPSHTIKTHHNVGGLPKKMKLALIEPFRELFKDEVRALGRELGIPDEILLRHPFPGPGLAIRILGEISNEKIKLLKRADRIFIDELKNSGLYENIWQAFSVLLPVQSVGVMGDARTYEFVLSLRAVTSRDGMTADWYPFDKSFLTKVVGRIISEVRGINRVVYDISSKPPSTIEWE